MNENKTKRSRMLLEEEAIEDCSVKMRPGRHWIALKESAQPQEATRPWAVLLSALGGATAARVAVERYLVSNTTWRRTPLRCVARWRSWCARILRTLVGLASLAWLALHTRRSESASRAIARSSPRSQVTCSLWSHGRSLGLWSVLRQWLGFDSRWSSFTPFGAAHSAGHI